MLKKKGGFVVLEGLDGAGTTTQSYALRLHLDQNEVPAVVTREPTDGPVGRFIREAISGNLKDPLEIHSQRLNERALCLLFAADRIEHSTQIERWRSEGSLVISDRYVHSSIAYQSIDPEITAEDVVVANRGCAVPDVTFFVKVPVEECLSRLSKRGDPRTQYESGDLLEKIARNYDDTRALYEKHFGPVIDIDGTQSVNDVLANIVRELDRIG